MAARDPQTRKRAAQTASKARWSRIAPVDRTAETQPARDGLRAHYARQIDPDGRMTDDALAPLLAAAMSEHGRRARLARFAKSA